eukprot:CAMPEP_0113536218 /NCGR_PEP_ID=MMETSP0015_2-20120614/6133_1 /TAXON_ID=2838 /ORGANISM="Odontella" /LENGTH=140 /DNA_ID=CAMNT_0000435547 /DNA_START=111 /DNA_END=529 /DNA_ORIENTATION=- /assembly_acc=CAM_ASM_000160
MGKRVNENAQMSKEDYEALQERSDRHGGSGAPPSGVFHRAGEEQLRRRKIIKVGRPSLRLFGSGPPPRKDHALNLKFLNMARNESRSAPMSDWSCWMRQYLRYAKKVTDEFEEEEDDGGDAGGAGAFGGGGGGRSASRPP